MAIFEAQMPKKVGSEEHLLKKTSSFVNVQVKNHLKLKFYAEISHQGEKIKIKR